MAMNDYETVALIAGGHTFGKTHGAGDPAAYVGFEPEGAGIEEQGLGWKNTLGTGHGEFTITSGLEGAWTPTPITWDNSYFDTLYGYEWELTKSPAGAWQWTPKDGAGAGTVPDAHNPNKRHAPMMATSDIALRTDPEYDRISRHFHQNFEELADAFARAWFKLTHRDMGPIQRYLGPLVPSEQLIWQDPVPPVDHELVGESEITELKEMIFASDLTISQLVRTTWAAAASFRMSDKRGGANGARLRLAPQRTWEANNPAELETVLPKLEAIHANFNGSRTDNVRISFADLIVLAGTLAVEEAAMRAGYAIKVGFAPGRTDATEETTDADSFAPLEPMADGFRNYARTGLEEVAAELLVDKANLLSLSAPEMTVLVGGLRALAANYNGSDLGVFTTRPGTLTNDFFTNLLDMNTVWNKSDSAGVLEGRDRKTGELKWKGTIADLVFGSNSILRSLAEVYAASDGEGKLVHDFARAWTKVMNLDRFDLRK
jgi:catalase-peroxidase